MWHVQDEPDKDIHYAFRGTLDVPASGQVEFRLSGSSRYIVWLDGEYFYEGPDRFPAAHPQYQSRVFTLSPGKHLVAVQVHHDGVETRMMPDIPPFLYCTAWMDGRELPMEWKCTRILGYQSCMQRISLELSWLEWFGSEHFPTEWRKAGFDDSAWSAPATVTRPLGGMTKSPLPGVKTIPFKAKTIAQGDLAEVFGYERDNPSARFFLRDLECKELPPQGVWKRYDLGRVMLSRPKFTLDLPKGAVVEFAFCEWLQHGRVAPWITLSMSDTYNMCHFVARGGVEEFSPFNLYGGRFVEVHVLSPEVKFIDETFIERSYYGEPQGSFHSSDPVLDRIWRMGADTYRSCTEDALTDNPTRERGQWLGDMGMGMMTGTAAYPDIVVCRRGLLQAAQCALPNGMVAGLYPGTIGQLSTYSAQWVTFCLNYWKYTGDKSILTELYPYAEANVSAFEGLMTPKGLSPDAGWGFVDWGYVPNQGPCDMGVNLHVYRSFLDMAEWTKAIGAADKLPRYQALAEKMEAVLKEYFDAHKPPEGYDWPAIGYHRAVLGIYSGFIPREHVPAAVAFIKAHILDCFPNNPAAPRLSDPAAVGNPRLITPYFSNYAFQVLIDNGHMDFVMGQYRKCWGWMLDRGNTTLLEVFDPRWSHCHQWGACPTWQLTRYALGLHPRFDKTKNHYILDFHPGSLTHASGVIPIPEGKNIEVSWKREEGAIRYSIQSQEPITVEIPSRIKASKKGIVKIKKELSLTITE